MCATKALLAGDSDMVSDTYRNRALGRGFGSGAWGWGMAFGGGGQGGGHKARNRSGRKDL
jgi:formate dehydrogenase iron-sulfur subunit